MRKVKQISQAGATNGYTIGALCDDGTMRAAEYTLWQTSTWQQITPVPQDTPTSANA